jgi:hypothetical protein
MAIFKYLGLFIYLSKDSASLLFWFDAFFSRGHSACFPSVGWVKYEVYYLLFMLFFVLLYVYSIMFYISSAICVISSRNTSIKRL